MLCYLFAPMVTPALSLLLVLLQFSSTSSLLLQVLLRSDKATLRVQAAWVSKNLEHVTWYHSAEKPLSAHLTWTGDGWGKMFLYCHQFPPHPALSSCPSSVPVKNRIWKCLPSRTGACLSGLGASLILIGVAGWYRRVDSFSYVAVHNSCAWDWNPICQVLCLHNKIKTKSWWYPEFTV